jgi:N utilization substance protein A
VPEIYDNTVVIRAIAREAGERTKIAVMSRDKDVDPVGACVGMKGMRVQSIIRELRGEKIDIIEYNEEITTFAEKALQPAKVSRVSIVDLADKQLEVIVDDTQLSLAIGKKGQNVRLAAKLLGWKIDIKSEEEKRQEVEQQMGGFSSGPHTPIEAVSELGEQIIQKLVTFGITTVEALADMTPEQLEEVPGIGEKTLERISVAVRHYFGQYEEGEVNPNASTEAPSEEAKATEVDEPGTPDEPVEEATAELKPDSDPEAALTETMEVENAADPERAHPVEADETVPVEDVAESVTESPEEVLEETEMAEEAAIDQDSEMTEKKGDA